MPPAIGARRSRRPIHIRLVGDAILARVRALVDEAAVAQRGKQLLHAALVPLFRGADEVVVGQPQPVPQPAKLAGNLRRKLLRRASGQPWPSARSSARARRCRSGTTSRCPAPACAAQSRRTRSSSRRGPGAAARSRSKSAWSGKSGFEFEPESVMESGFRSRTESEQRYRRSLFILRHCASRAVSRSFRRCTHVPTRSRLTADVKITYENQAFS